MPRNKNIKAFSYPIRVAMESAIKRAFGSLETEVVATETPDGDALDFTYDLPSQGLFARARLTEDEPGFYTVMVGVEATPTGGRIEGGTFENEQEMSLDELGDSGLLGAFFRDQMIAAQDEIGLGGTNPPDDLDDDSPRLTSPTAGGRSRRRPLGPPRRTAGGPRPAIGKGERASRENAEAGMQVRAPFDFEVDTPTGTVRVRAWSVGEIEDIVMREALPIWVNFPRQGVRAAFAEDELEIVEYPHRPPPSQPMSRRTEEYVEPEYEAPHFEETVDEYTDVPMGGEVFGQKRPHRGRPVPGRRPRRR